MPEQTRAWLAAALLALPVLGGCNLAPVYSAGNAGAAAVMLGAVEVDPIPDRNGFLVRDRLTQRLAVGNGNGSGGVRYRLAVRLDDRIEGFGVRGDNSIIRERRTMRARWQLYAIGTEVPLIDATAGADAGIDVVTSEFAVVAAETSAAERLADQIADQIVQRIALYARDSARTPGGMRE